MSVPLSKFANIYLPVYELKEGGALPVAGRETTVYGSSHCCASKVVAAQGVAT